MDDAGRRALDRESYVSLATFRKSGKAVETPVWCARAGEHFYVFSEGSAGKVKRLRNGSRIRVAPCTARGRVTGEWTEGSGRIVDDAATVETAYAALHAKYGWQMWIADALSRLTGRYAKRAMLELAL
jgi:hypothetical protein